MSSNNHSFTIRDERLESDRDDPWSAFEAPEVSGEGDGEGDTVVKSSERRRTLLIAGEGVLAGGLLGAFVATMVTLSSASGAASPVVHPAPAHRKSSAVVVGPAAPAHKPHHTVTHKTTAPPRKKPAAEHKSVAHRHTGKAAPKHTQPSKATPKHTPPASTARLHYRPRKNEPNPAHRSHRSSK